jgi:membrane-bound serine protease (ClpP class)
MLSVRSRFRAVVQVALFLLVGVANVPSSYAQTPEGPYAAVMSINGIINPAMASYVSRAIGQAEDTGASVIVIQMDTPGGLDTSMRDIIQRMIASKVPVVVYVSPSGARAASAGVYITYAAQIAAMAPSTNIGSAHPVALDQSGSEQQMTDTMTQKVTNDAVAYIKGLAQTRGRNADWAEQAVRNSVNITAEEALNQNVINVIAGDLPSLLDKIDGMTVPLPSGSLTLKTRGLPIQQLDMSPIEDFLHIISDPTIAYILLSLGTLGLIFELSSPGAILPGVVGGLFLLFALFGLGTLPINLAGLLLLAFAFLLFVADIIAPTHGILTAGGTVSFVLGSFMLINTRDAPFLAISSTAIVTLTVALVAFFAFVVRAVVRSRRRRPATGQEGILGQIGRARTELSPGGMVFADGALWEAISEAGAIAEDEPVRVVGQRGLTLLVRPVVPSKEPQSE